MQAVQFGGLVLIRTAWLILLQVARLLHGASLLYKLHRPRALGHKGKAVQVTLHIRFLHRPGNQSI